MSSAQQVNFNSGNTYNVNPGSPTYIPGQTTSTYRATAASTYGPNIGQAPLRTTNNYIAPQYVNNSQVGAQGYVNTQQRQTNTQQYTTTTYDNRANHQVHTHTQPVSTYNQPVVSATRNTYNVQEPKANPIANICFGLLGLIALVSLILGILFAVGVIGNKGVDVDPNVNNQGVPKTSHFRINHFEDQPSGEFINWNIDQLPDIEAQGSLNQVSEVSNNENEDGESEEENAPSHK